MKATTPRRTTYIARVLVLATVGVGLLALGYRAVPLLRELLVGTAAPQQVLSGNLAASTPATMLLHADRIVLPLATGQSTITATVRDARGVPVSGATLRFDATLGSVVPVEPTTNASGQAVATFSAGEAPGQANVVASVGSLSQTLAFDVRTPSSVREPTVTITTSVTSLLPGGLAQIRVTLRDSNGRPLSGEPVTLFASLGELSASSALSDANGSVAAAFTAGPTGGDARITVLTGYSSAEATLRVQLVVSPQTDALLYLPLIGR